MTSPGGQRLAWLMRWGLPLMMFLAVLALALTAPGFLTVRNLRNVGTQVPVNLILAAGMTLVILTGGIDLSIGSIHALAGVTAALVLTHPLLSATAGGWVVVLAILAAVATGAAVGGLNGSAVALIGIPPFIVTLATMRIARGLAKHLTDGTPVGIVGPDTSGWEAINERWNTIRPLGLGYLGDLLPISFLLAVVVTLLLGVWLTRSRYGRYIFAIGSSEKVAHLAGAPVKRVKLLAYLLMGLLAGLSGVIEMASLQSGSPVTGEGYELNAIAAVVVGGTRLTGGRGSMIGTFVGAVFVIGLMNNALNLYLVPPFWQEVASGVIIFAVALIDHLVQRRTAI